MPPQRAVSGDARLVGRRRVAARATAPGGDEVADAAAVTVRDGCLVLNSRSPHVLSARLEHGLAVYEPADAAQDPCNRSGAWAVIGTAHAL